MHQTASRRAKAVHSPGLDHGLERAAVYFFQFDTAAKFCNVFKLAVLFAFGDDSIDCVAPYSLDRAEPIQN